MTEPRGVDPTSLDDAALVRLVAEGNHRAFACLVERYGEHVLRVAARILQDRDDALESTQEAFLKAYQCIGTLRRPASFRVWLTTIARNHARQKLRKRRRIPVAVRFGAGTTLREVTELVEDMAPSAAEQAQINELRAEIRSALDKLSRKYKEIIQMFHLEAVGLPEIAGRLGIPLGTVKWRLSRAQALLRKELMMSEVTDTRRHESEASPLLGVKTIWGSDGPNKELRPWEVTKALLAQQILFCVRKTLKTAQDIARDVKADRRYVEEHLARMTRAEILEEHDGSYRANCILFDRDDIGQLRGELGKRGDAVAGVLGKHVSALCGAIAKTAPARQGFEEGYLRWIILPTMVLNLGISRRLEQVQDLRVKPPSRPDGGAWFFLPTLQEVHLPWGLGCNFHAVPNGWAQYWNSEIGVPITRITGEESILLHRLVKGPVKRESLVDVFSEDVVASMLDKGLVRADGHSIVANVPIFLAEDGDTLEPVLSGIIEDIVKQVYRDYPEDVYAILDRLGFEFAKEDYPAHAGVLAQMGSVRALIRNGVLPEPASPLPKAWGFFAWNGLFAPMEIAWR